MCKKNICLLVLALVGLFFTGCASNSAVTRVNQPGRSLVIVPVKGSPIYVRSAHTATFVLGGLAGLVVEQAANQNSSEMLADRLNQFTNFSAPRILAEECASLLKVSPKNAFHEVSIHPHDFLMPESKRLDPIYQRQFQCGMEQAGKWLGVYLNWKKSSAVAAKTGVDGQRTVFLEVTYQQISLNHNNMLQPLVVALRVIDPASGKILGYSYFSDSFDIAEVNETSDLCNFEADFRKSVNKLACEALKDLNLL